MADTTIRANRVKGGAIVRVVRDGREREYRVSLKRFARLKWVLSAWLGAHGYIGSNRFDIELDQATGYHDAVNWLVRSGSLPAKHAMRA